MWDVELRGAWEATFGRTALSAAAAAPLRFAPASGTRDVSDCESPSSPCRTPAVVRPQLYEAGMALFNDGQLRASYERFEKVVALVPVKSKVTGHVMGPACVRTTDTLLRYLGLPTKLGSPSQVPVEP